MFFSMLIKHLAAVLANQVWVQPCDDVDASWHCVCLQLQQLLANDIEVGAMDGYDDGTAVLAARARAGACTPVSAEQAERIQKFESSIERAIFDCRFFTLFAVAGSLAGSLLCFLKGSLFVAQSFMEYFSSCWQGFGTGKVILLLVEAVDVYLMGTVMLIFGMGLYELFVSTFEVPIAAAGVPLSAGRPICGSNLFGLFRLRERPKFLNITSLDELKTKLGHVIVMILLVGMFEKSKKVIIRSSVDLLGFSCSIFVASGSLYLLSKLHH
eukprot:SM000010S04257  [mRNA]  locus=s10:495426:497216:- [translate_table: standard]